LPSDWNNETHSKLWVYNLHYFEDLLSENAKEKRHFHTSLLNRWIDDNPIGHGNGWEAYPMSLRIVNILKAWLGGLEVDKKLFESVYYQASYLSNNLEKHLLGNHYFANLKALLFAGFILGNFRWINTAEKGLLLEIPEQILDDGANFELSPMYHCLMLIDMLDMLNLTRAYPTKVSHHLVSLLETYIPKMLQFIETMVHPDGGVSFFNDSADGIAPSKDKIYQYSKMLGFKINRIDSTKAQIIDNANSGYFCSTVSGSKLIFDASPIGCDYIPGHAHADTLSFELSIGVERVFVNSGTSEYGLSDKRLYQRKTKAHNTVEVDGKDSSQVWSGFRVANRAQIVDRFSEITSDKNIVLSAAHNGYKTLLSGCIHTRMLNFSSNKLIVLDSLEGSFQCAKAFFHFHPKLNVNLNNHVLEVVGNYFVMRTDLSGYDADVTKTLWHPQFGLSIDNTTLEIPFKAAQMELIFDWYKTSSNLKRDE